jgi:hypothetical protein
MTALIAYAKFVYLVAVATSFVHDLAPRVDDARVPAALAIVAFTEPPIFDDDADGTRTLAVLTAGAFEESSFNVDARGKAGEIGLMQIWRGGPAMHEPVANLREGLRQVRISFADFPSAPWAEFLGGPHGAASKHVRWLSDRRIKRAAGLLASLSAPSLADAVAVRP